MLLMKQNGYTVLFAATRPEQESESQTYSTIHLCMVMFTLCLSVRFAEYFLLETDKTCHQCMDGGGSFPRTVPESIF